MEQCQAVIRPASGDDLPRIRELLLESGLGVEGIGDERSRYWVAEEGAVVIGAIGLEPGDGCALLRSAIVTPKQRGRGIGRSLTRQALQWAEDHGYRAVYCFSTDAGDYWIRSGFELCPVDEVVQALPAACQVRAFDELGWLPTEVAYRIRVGPGIYSDL